jgi:hypothetical protein
MQVEVLLKATKDSREFTGLIEYDRVLTYPGEQPCILTFKSRQISELSVRGFDVFDNLCKLRKILEDENLQILCNGARVDVYPRGLARSMGGGYKLYILKMGKDNCREDLVKIFDVAESGKIGTVKEQFSFYQEWIKSLEHSDP